MAPPAPYGVAHVKFARDKFPGYTCTELGSKSNVPSTAARKINQTRMHEGTGYTEALATTHARN